jgi:hypothetical protein
MATTSKKKKKVSKKKSIKKVEIKKDALDKDTLDKDDLTQLENISRDVTIAQKDMAIEEQSLKNMMLKLELFKHDIISQRATVKARADRYENIKQKYVSFKKDIFPKYGLGENDRLGYNPETGEIVKE